MKGAGLGMAAREVGGWGEGGRGQGHGGSQGLGEGREGLRGNLVVFQWAVTFPGTDVHMAVLCLAGHVHG